MDGLSTWAAARDAVVHGRTLTIVLMGAVVGLSYFALWALFYGQSLDELTKVGPLLYGAAALFAPYAVNQIRGAISGLGSATKAAITKAPQVTPKST